MSAKSVVVQHLSSRLKSLQGKEVTFQPISTWTELSEATFEPLSIADRNVILSCDTWYTPICMWCATLCSDVDDVMANDSYRTPVTSGDSHLLDAGGRYGEGDDAVCLCKKQQQWFGWASGITSATHQQVDWLMITYIALFSALLSRHTVLACGSAWVTSFIARFLNIHRSGVLTALAWLVPHETAAISAQVLCTPYNHAPCHFMQSHIHKVYVCLAVTCHLHFWQNDQDLLHATVVTRGWNGYRVMTSIIYNSVHLKGNQIAIYPFQKQNKKHTLKQ